MTAKGQVTIPKRLHDYLGLKPGSEIEFIVRSDGANSAGNH
jgi:AbrB family looped-hinge helix DNA binding protein